MDDKSDTNETIARLQAERDAARAVLALIALGNYGRSAYGLARYPPDGVLSLPDWAIAEQFLGITDPQQLLALARQAPTASTPSAS